MEDTELVAVFDNQGRQIGIKTREKAHSDAEWHLIVFVIAAHIDPNGRIRSLMQTRAGLKDPYRGQIDVLAGGHVGAGESHLKAAIRECYEEVGVLLEMDELDYLGNRFLEDPAGICKRAIQHFYLCRRQIELTDVAFTAEVDGYVEVDLEELEQLLVGKRPCIRGMIRQSDQPEVMCESPISPVAFSAYSKQIQDTFRRTIHAVQYALYTGQIDIDIWK